MTSARPYPVPIAVLIPFAIVTLIWGSTWFVIRGQLGVPEAWSVAYRFTLAGGAMLAFAAARGERVVPSRAALAFASLHGFTQFTLNYNFVYLAEAHVTSGLVAVLFALLLVPNALLARIVLGQRLGAQLILGSVIAMAGVALLFAHELHGDPAHARQTALGIGFTLAAVLAASIGNVMQATDWAKRFPLDATLGTSMLIGAAIDALYALATVGPPVIAPGWEYPAGIAYLGLFGSSIAFTLYYRVIRVIGPAKAAYSSVIVPVIAMLLSTAFEGYRWSLPASAGAVLTAVGLVIALRARRPAR